MARLTPERTEEIFFAVLELIAEHGFEDLTMDALAARAHTSKATLYRHWADKTTLVVAALEGCMPTAPEAIADTGSLAGDLRALNVTRDDRLDEAAGIVVPLLNAARHEPALQEFLEGFLHRFIDVLISRAVDRGELAADDPILPYLPIVIVAPKVVASLIGQTPDTAYMYAYIDHVIAPLVGPGAGTERIKES